MSSAAVGTHHHHHHHHSGVGPLSLMSCVRESSPLQDHEPPDNEKSAASKKKFWNPKKWFKRKNKATEDVTTVEVVHRDDLRDLRSRSTSELSITDEQVRRRSGSSMHPGLSVSHDSVFHSPNSGSEIELDDTAQSSSSLSISQPQLDLRLQTELSERLRLRRGRGDTSEDDEGLPHSPCNSPTTADALLDKTAVKDIPTKSHSTCSDGSFLSMGSSEMEEESSFSQHSSKVSLQDKKSSDQDFDLELEPSSTATPLNHSAAHHRVSVRPNKRRAPHRNRKAPQLSNALPATPEVNEESSIRSVTPERTSRGTFEHYSKTTITETQIKCSSLPPGLALPGGDTGKLNRSRSNAGSRYQDEFATLEEECSEKEERNGDRSFFDRIFPRRSAKKRKSKEEKGEKLGSNSTRTESKPIAAPRTGAAARQRIQPIDLPPSPEFDNTDFGLILPRPSPEKSAFGGNSPLHLELENRIKKQRQTLNASLNTPPQSPKSARSIDASVIKEESRSKMKIPPLSSLQQKVLALNDDVCSDTDDNVDSSGFKSLNDLHDDSTKPIKTSLTKSHSFKSAKPAGSEQADAFVVVEATTKAASVDSVKSAPLEEEKNEEEVSEKEENVLPTSFSDVSSEIFGDLNSITISGPSHTAVVNVSSSTADSYNVANTKTETLTSGVKVREVTTKETVSVTKIQLKRESAEVTQTTVTLPKSVVPEFFNRQLNKVEAKSSSNVVLSMNSSSPRMVDEQTRPKSVFTGNAETSKINLRKFSSEDIEIIEKSDAQQPQPRFRKNDVNKRKSSVSSAASESPKSEKPFVRSRSISLDSLKGECESSDKSSQDSLDKPKEKEESVEAPVREKSASIVETVVMRKKSLIQQKTDEEPELMKVFARRSLKLKDAESETFGQQISSMMVMTTTTTTTDSDAKTRDSDKENQAESPQEERRKSSIVKEFAKPLNESKNIKKEENLENETAVKPPKFKESATEPKFIEVAEVTLKKPSNNNNNNNNIYPRSFSLNPPKMCQMDDSKVKKHSSFNERRITDNWISNIKNGDDLIEKKISQDEIIAKISHKSDYISEEVLTEKKNFIQRKAEWEKRAQEAQKKSVP